jgi:hypothetical protein
MRALEMMQCVLRVMMAVIFSFLTHLPVFAAETPHFVTVEALAIRLQEIRARSFPELAGQSLYLSTFVASDAFFQSNFEVASLLVGPVQYVIEVNPRIFALDCPPQAIDAVLAHELSHTLDYHRGGLWGILDILNQLRLYPSLVRYERRTDLQAVFRGYGPGLIAYRHWIYRVIPASDVAAKRQTYFTPEEIQVLLGILAEAEALGLRSRLETYWLADPPLSLAELKQDWHNFRLESGTL